MNPSINDRVEEIFLQLFVPQKELPGNQGIVLPPRTPEQEQFANYLDAVFDEDAVEGSLQADDHEAARMIREKAEELGEGNVSRTKLAVIIRALHVVLRRFGVDRKERKNLIE